MKFEIVWPDHRWVSEDQIKIWYSDALVNGNAEDETIFDDPEAMARELSDIGTITLGRGRC
jgi:hypothetical protein